jgi:uncharacterized membrane protein YbhN (UPF0104 family)
MSRERLLRLGATFAEHATTRRVRVVAQLLLLVALIFVMLRVRSIWHGSHIEVDRVRWFALAAGLAITAAATAATALIWLAILQDLGLQTKLRWAGLFFQTQLGKYIPGSVWQYAGRAAVARTYGIPVRPVALSLPIEAGASAVAAGATGALLLGWWGVAVVVGVAAVLPALGSSRRLRAPAVRAAIRATALYVPTWVVLGGTFWLFARGLVGVPARDLPLYAGAFAVAWLAGLVTIYAPGGIGVREAVLVALLSSRIGAGDALVVAAASRLALILTDVVFAGAGALIARDRSRLNPVAPV